MQQIKYLTDEELNYVINKVKNNNSRDALLIKTLMYTGCRTADALALDITHLNESSHSIWICKSGGKEASKGSVPRLIQVPKEFFDALYAYAKTRGFEKIFKMCSSRPRQIWRNFSPDSCRGHNKQTSKGLHSLRHTLAVKLYKKTKNIRLVQVTLGHSDIQNTLIYSTMVDQSRQIAEGLTDLYSEVNLKAV